MIMQLSDDTFVPSRDDGIGGIDVRRRESAGKAIYLDSFHQLRLERLENQRKAEQQWRRRKDSRIDLRCYSNMCSQSPSHIVGSLSNIGIRDRSNRASSISTNDDYSISSARQELLRLGRRYAISQRSKSTTFVSRTEHLFESQTPVSSPTKSVELTDPICLLDSKSMSSAASVPTCLHRDTNTPVVTPDGKEGIGIYSRHYLLLARANSLPKRKPEINSHVVDDEDGSHTSPTPNLQAASACNSPGENKGGYGHLSCEEERNQGILNQFSSFGRSHLSIFEMEDHQQTHRPDVAQSDTLLKDAPVQLNEKIIRSKAFTILVTITAIVVCWRYTLGWNVPDCAGLWSTKYHSCLHAMQWSYWGVKSMKNKLYSNMANGLKPMLYIRDPFPRFTLLAKLGWSCAVDVYTNWRKEFDLLSCMIHHIYRLQIMHQEIKHRFGVAWNITLSVVALFSEPLKSEQLSNTSHPFVPQDLNIMRSVSPLVSWSNDDFFSRVYGNKTEAVNELLSPKFWRAPIGPPFMRLPVTRHRCIHSIPSLGTWPEDSSISRSPPLSELRESNDHDHSQRIFLRRRPRLSLDKTRLDSIAISLDVHKNMAASTIMQKAKPPQHSEHFPREPSQAVTSVKRNHYESSYSSGHSDDKDIFEDVDVMKLSREFVGKLLNRGRWRVNNAALEDNH